LERGEGGPQTFFVVATKKEAKKNQKDLMSKGGGHCGGRFKGKGSGHAVQSEKGQGEAAEIGATKESKEELQNMRGIDNRKVPDTSSRTQIARKGGWPAALSKRECPKLKGWVGPSEREKKAGRPGKKGGPEGGCNHGARVRGGKGGGHDPKWGQLGEETIDGGAAKIRLRDRGECGRYRGNSKRSESTCRSSSGNGGYGKKEGK